MSVVFVKPLPFTASGNSPAPLAGSVLNVANDVPGLVWRGDTVSSLIVDLGASGASYNYVALFGSNLRSTDTVKITTGNTENGTGGYTSGYVATWSGPKDDSTSSKVIVKLTATRTERYIRIDINATDHPDEYVQFSRLIIGSAIINGGIEIDAEHGFETQSVITTGPGYRTTEKFYSLDSWKISTDWIDADDWRAFWTPMLRHTSSGGGVMFIADDTTPATWQTDALYGFMTTTPTGKWEAYNKLRFETKIIAYAP